MKNRVKNGAKAVGVLEGYFVIRCEKFMESELKFLKNFTMHNSSGLVPRCFT